MEMLATDLTDPPIRRAAEIVFGERLPQVRVFADLLVDVGLQRGLLGPREVPRLWERHLLNCASVATVLPHDARVVDVGSGAGLPGLVLALARPDLRVDLVEPLLRRATFLTESVEALALIDQVRVVRGRAEESTVRQAVGGAGWVTARAVAPLDRLVTWCLPLLRPGGSLVALKGARARTELADHAQTVRAAGAERAEVLELPVGADLSPTWVIRVSKADSRDHAGSRKRHQA